MASKVMNDGDRSETQTERNSPDLRINRPLERPGINFELNFSAPASNDKLLQRPFPYQTTIRENTVY